MIVIIVRLIFDNDQDWDILWERTMIIKSVTLMMLIAPIVKLLMMFRIVT